MSLKYKVLLIYPNNPFQNPAPMSYAVIAAELKKANIDIRIFDTTYYNTDIGSDKKKEENLNVKSFSYDGFDIPKSINRPEVDLVSEINEYKPDLIGISLTEGTWKYGYPLLDAIKEIDIPVIAGGVFPTFAPDLVFNHPAVTYIGSGEGEGLLVELCERLRDGHDISNIKNIYIKNRDGSIKKNPVRKVVDLNSMAMPDFTCFHPSRLLRPMAGKVYRTIPIETNRGCPFQCTFCNSPTTAKYYREQGAGHFFRKKSIARIKKELIYYVEKYDPEYFYFLSDTFLIMAKEEFDEFADFYETLKIPFWIQSRIETLDEHIAKRLKEIGCHRMSIGLEHGNEEFRRKILKKDYKNDVMIERTKLLKKVGIPFSLNNIIGFPGETRELIFDTVELNRKIPFDDTNAYAFTPFHGTPLHAYCLEQKLISKDRVAGIVLDDTPLDMPQLSAAEIGGLRKTFVLYVRMPKTFWPEVRIAESNTPQGYAKFNELRVICKELYM